jgi:hypothetical protein
MQELEIEIIINRETEAVYRFSDFPVHIGRDRDCHLSICHESVPRKLCKVWLEQNGHIHMEENPGLSNPLFENGKRMHNGVVKPAISAQVGPIGLEIRNVASTQKRNTARLLRPGTIAVAFAGLFALAMAASFILLEPVDYRTVDVTDFPKTIAFPQDTLDRHSSIPVQMLMQLAQTEYMRTPVEISRQIQAIAMMKRAATSALPASPTHRQAALLATRWEQAVNASYRLEIIALFSAIERNDSAAIQKSAEKLLDCLHNADAPIVEWLQRIHRKDAPQ